MSVQPARSGRSRVEQTAATQRRILDATVEVLVERGYGGTSTLEVQQRAGVSRGSLLHHYASRTQLIVAAVEHLTRERIAELPLVKSQAPSSDRLEWAVRTMWGTFQGPLYAAALELWTAARHEPDLREALLPQERLMGQFIRTATSEVFGPEYTSKPGFPEAFDILLDAQRGAAARSVLRTHDSDARLIEGWVKLMRRLCDD